MNSPLKTASLLVLGVIALSMMGCQSRYMTNRYYDARDTIAMGAGVTAENNKTGIIPPSLGLYFEATDWFHLGAITHNGYTAELDLRGTYVGPERMSRFGFLWWQKLHINQVYPDAHYYNAFKDRNFPWCHRMESVGMRTNGRPAKRLHYEPWSLHHFEGTGLLHRGKQYWEYVGIQGAISEPFITHLGVMLRLGFDLSEVSDFVLGWFNVDYKYDDMTEEEFELFELMKRGDTLDDFEPVEQPEPVYETPPDTTNLEKDMEPVGGQVDVVDQGIEIVLDAAVFFDSGSAVIKPEGKQVLDNVANRIRSEFPDHEVIVMGHTDNVPVVISKYKWDDNWDLGAGRSISVIKYFQAQHNMPGAKFGALTYGEYRPVADNETSEGRATNRRVILLLRPIR